MFNEPWSDHRGPRGVTTVDLNDRTHQRILFTVGWPSRGGQTKTQKKKTKGRPWSELWHGFRALFVSAASNAVDTGSRPVSVALMSYCHDKLCGDDVPRQVLYYTSDYKQQADCSLMALTALSWDFSSVYCKRFIQTEFTEYKLNVTGYFFDEVQKLKKLKRCIGLRIVANRLMLFTARTFMYKVKRTCWQQLHYRVY